MIIRGIKRKAIFRDETDQDGFVDRLLNLILETQTSCYAWVLMTNHAHFLFRSGPRGLAGLMQRLLTGQEVGFNRRHKRHGQLFQNRYKSIICQEDTYLNAGIDMGRRPELIGGGLIRSLGGWSKVKKLRLKGMNVFW